MGKDVSNIFKSLSLSPTVSYAAETPVIDYATRIHCDLMKVGGEIYPRPNAFAYSKKVDAKIRKFMENVDDVIYQLKESGAIDTLKNKWWYELFPKKKCYEYRKLYNGITLKNAGGIFIVIAAGVIMTVLSLWVENWYYDARTREDMRKARARNSSSPDDSVKRKGGYCSIQ